MSHRKITICPHCDFRHNRVAAADPRNGDDQPADGDVTLCFRCGEFCIFDDDIKGGLRKMNAVEANEINNDPDFVSVQAAWHSVERKN